MMGVQQHSSRGMISMIGVVDNHISQCNQCLLCNKKTIRASHWVMFRDKWTPKKCISEGMHLIGVSVITFQELLKVLFFTCLWPCTNSLYPAHRDVNHCQDNSVMNSRGLSSTLMVELVLRRPDVPFLIRQFLSGVPTCPECVLYFRTVDVLKYRTNFSCYKLFTNVSKIIKDTNEGGWIDT